MIGFSQARKFKFITREAFIPVKSHPREGGSPEGLEKNEFPLPRK
jgi:hypothetical protein